MKVAKIANFAQCETLKAKCFKTMKNINDQEKAALYFAIAENCTDWAKIYSIAVGADKFNQLADITKVTNPNKWKNSTRIKRMYEELLFLQQHREDKIREKVRKEIQAGETETTETKNQTSRAGATDFLNRDEFLKFLNQRANEITDDKLRNDILKMLSDNMRYKESESETSEIQRFYTPVVCQDCEIYRKCSNCSGCPGSK